MKLRMLREAAVVVLLLSLLVGCGQEVDGNTPDTTPPKVGIDAYGIPRQSPGQSDDENPLSVNSKCCMVTRYLTPGVVDFVVTASDNESGIKSLKLLVSEDGHLCHGATGGGDIVAQDPPPVVTGPTATPTTAPSQRLVQYQLQVPARPRLCPTLIWRMLWQVSAYAENWAGKQAVVTLLLRIPLTP